jgi:hypothetical protein
MFTPPAFAQDEVVAESHLRVSVAPLPLAQQASLPTGQYVVVPPTALGLPQ